VIDVPFLDSAPVVELMGEEPRQSDTKLSRVGNLGELVGTSLLNQYLNDIVGRWPRPHHRGGIILGIASLRHEYKGTILNITLDEHNNVVVPAYIIQHV
jgi:hypothetical protein